MHEVGDSSVEDILATIKKVIERDNRETAKAARNSRSTSGIMLHKSAEPHNFEEQDEGEDVLDLSASGAALLDDDEPETTPDIESLTSPSVEDDIRKSLSALSMLSGPSAKPRGPVHNDAALEGIVREMLRPMLSDWLDRNLPDIVGRMVRDEIDRIAGKRG